ALAIAAVIGRDFDLRVLQEVAAMSSEAMLEALDEAQAARVIVARAPGRYRYHFTHVLISDTLADGLPVGRRMQLHRRVGEALDRAGAHGRARIAFCDAAEAARELRSSERLARAALGYGGPRGSFGVVDEELVGLLEETLASGELGDGVRARLLARLAMELY